MKAEHPFLTSGEDSSFCALSALSDRSDDDLISDMEACFKLLKPEFFSGNAVQSLAHVLSLCEGTPEEKCRRTLELFNNLKAAGRKYGTEYELPTLGIFAMTDVDSGQIVQEMLEIDEWQKEHIRADVVQTAAVNSTVALVVAQEAAMCAAVAASTAAAAAASSASN